MKESSVESFYFFLRFNVRFLGVLLQTIQPELEVEDNGEDLPGEGGVPRPGRAPERITAITRRVLPALRQYSIWLVSCAPIINASVHKQSIASYIQEVWRMYASVLTKLIRVFPVTELPIVNYLLEEDETTVGFMPFRDPSLSAECDLYTGQDGLAKPRSTDPGVERNHPNIEMKGRIRDILLCVLVMRQKQDLPIDLNTSTLDFTFTEGSQQSTGFGPSDATPTSTSPVHVKRTVKAPEPIPDTSQDDMRAKNATPSDSHQSMDTDMHRMVDSLLEASNEEYPRSNETSYGMHTETANEIFRSMGGHSGYQPPHINTQSKLPILPSILNSPFALQPNEMAVHSPTHESTSRNLFSMQSGNPGQQDRKASYKDSRSASWGKPGSIPTSSSTTQAVNSSLQDSHSQQFMPSVSSFSSSSSIYGNTTRIQPAGNRAATSYLSSNGNNMTSYPGTRDYNKIMRLQSSIVHNSSQPGWGGNGQTPPGGQRG